MTLRCEGKVARADRAWLGMISVLRVPFIAHVLRQVLATQCRHVPLSVWVVARQPDLDWAGPNPVVALYGVRLVGDTKVDPLLTPPSIPLGLRW